MRAISLTLLYMAVFSAFKLSHGKAATQSQTDHTGTDRVDWAASAQKDLEASLMSCFNTGMAKNVILFVGDGMGMSTVTAARWLQAQRDNVSIHETHLAWDKFPHTGLSKTYNVDVITPDSAGTATALLTGVKARMSTIGVNQDVIPTKCNTMKESNKMQSIIHKSHTEGKWTGVVTTTRATHATPAASYASSPSRNWESDSDIPADQQACKDIAYQLVKENDFIRVFLAGGRVYFIPENETDPEHSQNNGMRKDGRDLMKEWVEQKRKTMPEDKFKLVLNDTDFKAVDANTVDYLLGLFEASHMQFEADRTDPKYEKWGEPSLTEMAKKALSILQRSKKGYFLLVEGGRIDHAHHDGNAFRALDDALEFSRAVQQLDELTDDDTLIIVTSDHSHTFTLGGYPSINRNIFDVANGVEGGEILGMTIADDGLPFTTLAYANGPGYDYHFSSHNQTTKRRNLTEDSLSGKAVQKDYLQPAGVPLSSETHGGEDVAIYAKGPMAHLFHGTHEQTYVAHVMMYASCVGDNKEHCENRRPFKGPCSGAKNNQRASLWSISMLSSIMLVLQVSD